MKEYLYLVHGRSKRIYGFQNQVWDKQLRYMDQELALLMDRASAQYLKLQRIYFSSDNRRSFGFINDQQGDHTSVTSNGNVIQAQTWFTLKIYYDHTGKNIFYLCK